MRLDNGIFSGFVKFSFYIILLAIMTLAVAVLVAPQFYVANILFVILILTIHLAIAVFINSRLSVAWIADESISIRGILWGSVKKIKKSEVSIKKGKTLNYFVLPLLHSYQVDFNIDGRKYNKVITSSLDIHQIPLSE